MCIWANRRLVHADKATIGAEGSINPRYEFPGLSHGEECRVLL